MAAKGFKERVLIPALTEQEFGVREARAVIDTVFKFHQGRASSSGAGGTADWNLHRVAEPQRTRVEIREGRNIRQISD
jgi:hypothetical protein